MIEITDSINVWFRAEMEQFMGEVNEWFEAHCDETGIFCDPRSLEDMGYVPPAPREPEMIAIPLGTAREYLEGRKGSA